MANKVPNIRFKGFTDDWEQRKLGEVADIVGGGTPSTSKDEYWDGDIDWYAPAEIINQIFVFSSERKITQEGYDNSSAKMLPIGTVLFTSRAGIGKMAILSKEGCTNQGFQSIVPHANELDSYFIFSRASELKKYGETVGAGSTFVEVSGKQMSNMNLLLPKDINEQQKIGEYFSNLDNLITLHQRKCDQTKELKKFMLQKMFPKKGEKNPEIRFSGFTDDWEQREFGEILNVYSFKQYIKEPESNGKYKIIQQGNEPIIGYANGNPFEEYKNIVLFGDHTVSLYKPQEPFFVATDGVKILGTTKNLDGNFFNATLEKYKPESEGYKRHFSILKKQRICFTENSDEQRRVGNFFENLDRLITLHQRKCEQLKELKKFMLQNMFPKKG